MSAQDETQDPAEPTEPTEPETPTEEPDIPLEDPEPDLPAEPTEPTGARDDAEIDAVYTKLETRAKNYVKSASEIIGDAGVPVTSCEMCADCYPGLRWLEAQDELHATLLSVVGAASGGSPLNDDPDALLCDRCNGFGHTKLPSHVPGNDTRLCRQCNGAGWLDRNRQSGAPQAPTPEPVNGDTAPLPGVPEDDPSVVDLRSRGFTVIPPMRISEQV